MVLAVQLRALSRAAWFGGTSEWRNGMKLGERMAAAFQGIKERARDVARFPLIALVIFMSAMAAWLGIWAAWRLAQWVFETYLSRSWVQ